MLPWKFGTVGLSQAADSQGPLVSMQHEAGSAVGSQSSSVQNYGQSQARTPMSGFNQRSRDPAVVPSYGYTSSQAQRGLSNPGYSTLSQSGGSSGMGGVYQGPAAQTARDSYSTLSTAVRNPNSGRGFWYRGLFGLPAQHGGEQPVGGVGPQFLFPNGWPYARNFPDLSVLNTAGAVPQAAVAKVSPLPPSSYIIQSRNAYDRAREVMSHSTYTPEDIYLPPYPPMVEGPSGMSPPGPPEPPRSPPQVKGGQKV